MGFSTVTAAKNLDLLGCLFDVGSSAVTTICINYRDVFAACFDVGPQGMLGFAILAASGQPLP